MKRALLTLVFLLGFSILSFSQEKNNLDELISGRWRVEYMEIDGEKIDLTQEENWMVFHNNGVYQLLLDQKEELGTWDFTEGQDEIKFDAKTFDGISKIKKLSNKEFLFSIAEGDLVCTLSLRK